MKTLGDIIKSKLDKLFFEDSSPDTWVEMTKHDFEQALTEIAKQAAHVGWGGYANYWVDCTVKQEAKLPSRAFEELLKSEGLK